MTAILSATCLLIAAGTDSATASLQNANAMQVGRVSTAESRSLLNALEGILVSPSAHPVPKLSSTGKYDLECDMFVNCIGLGWCDRLSGECVCYTGWEGERCSSINYTISCPWGFTGTGKLLECLPYAKNVFTGECSAECDMFVNCSRHGRCNGQVGECICHDGWTGDACNESYCDMPGFTGVGADSARPHV